MSNEQSQVHGARMDEALFHPLYEFFAHDEYSSADFECYIFRTGYPVYRRHSDAKTSVAGWINNYKGFVLDAYVKYLLTRFADIKGYPLRPTVFTSGELLDGHVFAVNKWGNISLYNPSDGNDATELDGLYEFDSGSSITPVIFEITYNTGARNVQFNAGKKRELVRYLYSEPSYLCKVTPVKGKHKPGLFNTRMPYRRDIEIPRRDFRQIVKTLCALGEKARNRA